MSTLNFAILGSRGFPSTYSGYETLVRHLAPYLVDAGHRATVYGREPSGGRRVWTTGGVRCIATPGISGKSLSTPSFGLTSAIDAAFRKFDAAIVLNVANGFWLPLLRLAGIPTAVNTDGVEWERGKWNRLAKAIFRKGAQLSSTQATELICDSRAMAEIWVDLFDRRSTYIPYGAPLLSDVPDDRLDEYDLRGRPFLLSVARLVPENNVDLTLDALDLLRDRDLATVIVGSSVGRSEIADRLTALGHSGKVLWLGHVSDQDLLTQLWAHCAVYVHGHSVGGTNPSLLQAMGAGAPTLALETRFNAEVLDNPEQLYRPEPAVLAEKIAALLDRPATGAEFARHERQQIAERYTWDHVCGRYLSVLERIARD